MNKLCIFLGMTIFSWLGWWIAEGLGFMTAFIVSGLASMLGVYAGWRINQEFFE